MDKLNKLQDLLKLLNEGLTREEFIKNFGLIIDLVKKLQAKNDQILGSIDAKYNSIVDDIRRNYDKDMEGVNEKALKFCEESKEEALEYCKKMMKEITDNHESRMVDMEYKTAMMDEELKPKVVEMCKEEIMEEIMPLIPAIESIENDIPKLGEPIRDSLELLPEGEKLKIEAIEKLREELDDLRKMIQRKVAVMGGGGVGKHNVNVYDLSSSLNGVLTTFSLPSLWKVIDVKLSSVPVLRPTTDYTVSGNTLTFTSQIDASTQLSSGQSLLVIYSE